MMIHKKSCNLIIFFSLQDITPGYDNQLGYWIPDVPDDVVRFILSDQRVLHRNHPKDAR